MSKIVLVLYLLLAVAKGMINDVSPSYGEMLDDFRQQENNLNTIFLKYKSISDKRLDTLRKSLAQMEKTFDLFESQGELKKICAEKYRKHIANVNNVETLISDCWKEFIQNFKRFASMLNTKLRSSNERKFEYYESLKRDCADKFGTASDSYRNCLKSAKISAEHTIKEFKKEISIMTYDDEFSKTIYAKLFRKCNASVKYNTIHQNAVVLTSYEHCVEGGEP